MWPILSYKSRNLSVNIAALNESVWFITTERYILEAVTNVAFVFDKTD